MPDLEKALMAEAEHIAANMQVRTRTLEAELADIERRKAHLEAELQAAAGSRERLARFQSRIGRNYQCPRCWVPDATNYTVRAIPSPNENDLLRCDRCGGDWEISF
jgi:hypothetical protein